MPHVQGYGLSGLTQRDVVTHQPSLAAVVSGKHCGGGGSAASRRRKARTVFSDQQLNGLEERFEAQKYLSTPERVELASQLNLSETQVAKYYINIII